MNKDIDIDTNNQERITAIVLSAGFSSRMSAFKPLLPIGEKPALYRILDSLFYGGIEEVVLVTGHESEKTTEAAKTYVQSTNRVVHVAHNPDYKKGMFTSVKAGIRFVMQQGRNTVLLHPVDVLLVAPQTIRAVVLTAQKAENRDCFILPCFHGKNGHPLRIPSSSFDAILRYEGAGGLRAIRDANSNATIRIETDDEGCILDMDTPEDYQRIKKRAHST